MSLPRPRDMMRAFLVLVLLTAFQAALFWLFQFPIPATNRDLVTYMLGQLSGFLATALVFYFGTTQSSREKTDMIEAMTRAPASPANVKPDDPDAGPIDDLPAGRANIPKPDFGG